jgi:hypothetical protein
MIRFLGFLIGSAVSISLFLLILGVPDINLSRTIENAQLQTVAETATEIKEDIEAVATEFIDEVSAKVAEDTGESKGSSAGEATDASADERTSQETVLASEPAMAEALTPEEPQIFDLPAEPELPIAAFEPATDDVKWHAFWNPFRSRLAAEGFVGQLEKVTGLDYRVVKIKTGVYEVTFAYEDDEERRSKMSLIASATGLDLPES